MSDPAALVVELLEEHGYSSSPWLCRCGAALVNANAKQHVADMIVTAFKIGGSS